MCINLNKSSAKKKKSQLWDITQYIIPFIQHFEIKNFRNGKQISARVGVGEEGEGFNYKGTTYETLVVLDCLVHWLWWWILKTTENKIVYKLTQTNTHKWVQLKLRKFE